MTERSLPNLIVIGAQKAGTSSLHSYLDLHPDIAMARPKELDFFCGPGWNWDRGLDWYAAHFGSSASVRGESSPNYAFSPYIEGVPERVRSVLPETRLIYVVRDPVERMISQYLHVWARGLERRPIADVFSDPRFHGTGYVAKSRYAMQLKRYLEQFPAASILVIDRDDLLSDRGRTLARVFGFLGVDPEFESTGFARMHNESRDHRAHRALKRGAARIARPIGLEPLATRLVGAQPVERVLSRRLRRPAIDPALREAAADHVRDDAARLRRLTGQPFGRWSV